MRKKLMKTMALVLSFVMICLNVDTNYIKAEATDANVVMKNHGVNDAVEKPATLEAGQVWANKDVEDHGDGTFTITLSAMANNYQDGELAKAPLKENTTLTFTDVIGKGFEVEGTLPEGMTIENNTATWVITSDQLTVDANGPVLKTVSFKVKYSAKENGTYYTNEKAEAQFTPSEDNPFYYDVTPATETTEKVVTAKADKNLENGSVKQTLKTIGWVELEAKEVEQPKTDNEEINGKENETLEAEAPFDPSTVVPYTNAAPLYDYTKHYAYRSGKVSGVPSNFQKTKTDALETNKTAEYNPNTNATTINLEAFLTGDLIKSGKPIDFVLVLDQSGSMADPIGEGGYYPVYSLSTNATYYVGENHTQVSYRQNGWWTSWAWRDDRGNIYSPKTSANDDNQNHTQFYAYKKAQSKLEALKESVTNFIGMVEDSANKTNLDHRIGVVGFAIGDKTSDGWNSVNYPIYYNTGILSYKKNNSNQSIVNYGSISDVVYKNTLQSPKDENGKEILTNAVNLIDADGATRIDLGLELAENILEKNKSEEREKVVITFTDGLPTGWGTYDNNVANDAITITNRIKQNYNATCYSIGVVNNANPSAELYKDVRSGNDNQKNSRTINKFLHLISNNYVGDYDMSYAPRNQTKFAPNNEGYYLAAENAAQLDEIFNEIFSKIEPKMELGSDAVLVDKLSDYFKFDINKADIKVYTQEYKGGEYKNSNSWSDRKDITNNVSVDTSGDTIKVKGFDYTDNVVYLDEDNSGHGKKLIVEISNVKTIDGFIGGNGVPTNKDDSGIYDKDNNIVENFDTPTVDVPIRYDFDVNDASIYIGDHWENFEELLTKGYKIDGKSYTWGDKRNDFVDIIYFIDDEPTTNIASYKIEAGNETGNFEHKGVYPTEDLNTTKTFKVKAVIDPIKRNNDNDFKMLEYKDANLYVFTPTVKVTDDVVFYGDLTKINDRYQSSDQVTWECKDNPKATSPKTERPDLNIKADKVYSNNATEEFDNLKDVELSKDTQFKLKVSRKTRIPTGYEIEIDITANTDIKNTSNPNDQDQYHDFTIYVVKGQLNITKTIDQQYVDENDKFINANQSFLFRIDRRDEKNGEIVETFYQTIDFSANQGIITKTVKILDLKKGYYTVTEDTNWSWKYQLNSKSDDYKGNADGTTSDIYIGDKENINTKPYYGVKEGTTVKSVEYGNPANTYFQNSIKQSVINILGDVASAINSFGMIQ